MLLPWMRRCVELVKGKQGMDAKKLSVKMFGGFSARYGNEILTFGRQEDSKFVQLFQILMTEPEQGVSKRSIAESLYSWDKVENPNASLNNTIFRLRKYLETSLLPPGEYLSLSAGIVRFGGDIETESDVWLFEKVVQTFKEECDRRKKVKLCEEAGELYRGEFLPHLSNEQWVIDKSRRYQNLYFEMMKYLFGVLKEEEDYVKLEKMSEHVAEIYPNEGWEIWQIDSMIALKKYKKAKELYQKMNAYMQKTGDYLSKEQGEYLSKVEERMRWLEGTEENIRRWLMETVSGQGAYSSTLQGFSDCFRMLKRVMKRETFYFCLFLCTILDNNGQPLDNREYCEKQGKKLCAVFRTHLRKGDIYTKLREGQYLLLCVGMERANISEIGERIDMDFRKRCGGRGGISCRLLDDGGIP